ncbi:MAG: MBL fold metallo-hydrolase [Thiohalomonadales bacterium]
MKTVQYIYENGEHKWAIIARDPARPEYIIDTNEYLVINHDNAMLLDPGGQQVFPAVFSAISQHYDPGNIKVLFASHQDPDIISSLDLWLEVNPAAKCYLSWLWASFVPHFGGSDETFIKVPDEGMDIDFYGLNLAAVPAHYLHSSGNFHLYDKKAKILFTGDVGAALGTLDQNSLYVEDFIRHIKFAEGFHRRWMGSNEAKQDWCERVSNMDIDMLCPQHGAIYRGDDVSRFINWFADLKVGIAA